MKTIKAVSVKVSVLELDVYGAVVEYRERKWIEDPNQDDGGSFQYFTMKYDRPRVAVSFKGKVDQELQVGCTYSDGANNFVAVSKELIVNVNRDLISFQIPKELFMVGSMYGG